MLKSTNGLGSFRLSPCLTIPLDAKDVSFCPISLEENGFYSVGYYTWIYIIIF
jgi:hypothetical protein